MFSLEYTFENWDKLFLSNLDDLIVQGQAILTKQDKDLKELLSMTTRKMVIGGHEVPTANMPYTFASEAGNILSKNQPFAATYYDSKEGRHFSLRSDKNNPDALDVSLICVKMGGGGHQNAGGFKVPLNKLVESGLL